MAKYILHMKFEEMDYEYFKSLMNEILDALGIPTSSETTTKVINSLLYTMLYSPLGRCYLYPFLSDTPSSTQSTARRIAIRICEVIQGYSTFLERTYYAMNNITESTMGSEQETTTQNTTASNTSNTTGQTNNNETESYNPINTSSSKISGIMQTMAANTNETTATGTSEETVTRIRIPENIPKLIHDSWDLRSPLLEILERLTVLIDFDYTLEHMEDL